MLNDAITIESVLELITVHVHESTTQCISIVTITIISNYAKDPNPALGPTITWCTNPGNFQESM